MRNKNIRRKHPGSTSCPGDDTMESGQSLERASEERLQCWRLRPALSKDLTTRSPSKNYNSQISRVLEGARHHQSERGASSRDELLEKRRDRRLWRRARRRSRWWGGSGYLWPPSSRVWDTRLRFPGARHVYFLPPQPPQTPCSFSPAFPICARLNPHLEGRFPSLSRPFFAQALACRRDKEPGAKPLPTDWSGVYSMLISEPTPTFQPSSAGHWCFLLEFSHQTCFPVLPPNSRNIPGL